MTWEYAKGAPLLVGVTPKQHPEVLQTAANLAATAGRATGVRLRG